MARILEVYFGKMGLHQSHGPSDVALNMAYGFALPLKYMSLWFANLNWICPNYVLTPTEQMVAHTLFYMEKNPVLYGKKFRRDPWYWPTRNGIWDVIEASDTDTSFLYYIVYVYILANPRVA